MEIIASLESGIPPAMLKAWALGSCAKRQIVDDLFVKEINQENPNLEYLLKREKKGSTRLKLISIQTINENN